MRRRRHRPERSTASGAPTCATSCSSRRRSPTSRRSCSTRTTAARRPSSTPPTRSSTNNLGRKPKHLWTDQGTGDRIVRYHAEDEGDEATWVARTAGRPARAATATAGATWPSSTAPTPRAGWSRRRSCASASPYKVVGGTRFYDRREIKDAMAYLRAVVNPADEVSVKRVLNVPKRGVGDATRRPARRASPAPRASPSSRRCAAPTRPASPGPRPRGIAAVRRAARRPAPTLRRRRAPATCCRPRSTVSGYLAELRGRAHRRGRGPAREPRRAGRLGPGVRRRVDEFLEQVALVADTDELDDDETRSC